jgi:hypothetical protein
MNVVKLPAQMPVRRKWDYLAGELRRLEDQTRDLLVVELLVVERRGPVAKAMFKVITSLRKARYEAEKMADQERDR